MRTWGVFTLAGSEAEFWIAQVRAGTMSIEEVPKKLRGNVRDILGLDGPKPATVRNEATTFTLEQMQQGEAIVDTVRNMANRVMSGVGRAGPVPTRAPVIDTRASSMAEVIAYLEASPSEAAMIGTAFLNSAYSVRKDMETIAIALVNDRRRRRGWAARFNYPDRGGRHYLEEAIRGSAVVRGDMGQTPVRSYGGDNPGTHLTPGSPNAGSIANGARGRQGSGLAMVAWDIDRLEEMTRTPRSNKGFIMMYEKGGSYPMPPGFWIGPTGPNTTGKTGKRFQKRDGMRGSMVTPAGHLQGGPDRFYPGAGTHNIFMREPAMNVLRDSMAAANERVLGKLRKEFSGSINLEKEARARASGGSSEISEVYAEDAYTANVDQ